MQEAKSSSNEGSEKTNLLYLMESKEADLGPQDEKPKGTVGSQGPEWYQA